MAESSRMVKGVWSITSRTARRAQFTTRSTTSSIAKSNFAKRKAPLAAGLFVCERRSATGYPARAANGPIGRDRATAGEDQSKSHGRQRQRKFVSADQPTMKFDLED